MTEALKLLPGLGLSAGFALDLTTTDEHGSSWDFTKDVMKDKARNKVQKEKPMLLIGSPSCTAFCAWQALNAAMHGLDEGGKQRMAALRAEAEAHMAFVIELYQLQKDAGKVLTDTLTH